MKCCINNFDNLLFTNDTNNIEEISFNFEDIELVKLIEKIQEYSNKRIILDVEVAKLSKGNECLDTLKMLYDAYKNIVLRLDFSNINVIRKLKKLDIPFFLRYSAIADSFDRMEAICALGVTDVYVAGEICFSMDRVKSIADKYEVAIRVLPNVVRHSGQVRELFYQNLDSLTSFWIRPGDLYLYEDYVDIIEFFAPDNLQETYYEMYFTEVGYKGNLSIAIDGLNEDIKNTCIPSEFTEARLNCGKRCRFNECHKCHKYAALAKLMLDNDLEVEEGE